MICLQTRKLTNPLRSWFWRLPCSWAPSTSSSSQCPFSSRRWFDRSCVYEDDDDVHGIVADGLLLNLQQAVAESIVGRFSAWAVCSAPLTVGKWTKYSAIFHQFENVGIHCHLILFCRPWLLAITAVPAIFQIATLPFCPESPKYLLLDKDDEHGAEEGLRHLFLLSFALKMWKRIIHNDTLILAALQWLRGTIEVHDEMDEMKQEQESMKLVPKVLETSLLPIALQWTWHNGCRWRWRRCWWTARWGSRWSSPWWWCSHSSSPASTAPSSTPPTSSRRLD